MRALTALDIVSFWWATSPPYICLLSSIQRLVFERIEAHNDIVHKRHQRLRSGHCSTGLLAGLTVSLS